METLDIGDTHVVKASDALAGGTSLSAEGTCGALVGGLLAISSIAGRSNENFKKGSSKIRVFQPSKKSFW